MQIRFDELIKQISDLTVVCKEQQNQINELYSHLSNYAHIYETTSTSLLKRIRIIDENVNKSLTQNENIENMIAIGITQQIDLIEKCDTNNKEENSENLNKENNIQSQNAQNKHFQLQTYHFKRNNGHRLVQQARSRTNFSHQSHQPQHPKQKKKPQQSQQSLPQQHNQKQQQKYQHHQQQQQQHQQHRQQQQHQQHKQRQWQRNTHKKLYHRKFLHQKFNHQTHQRQRDYQNYHQWQYRQSYMNYKYNNFDHLKSNYMKYGQPFNSRNYENNNQGHCNSCNCILQNNKMNQNQNWHFSTNIQSKNNMNENCG